MARTESLPKERVRSLVALAFDDLRRSADRGFRPITSLPELEIEEQREFASSRISGLQDQLALTRFDSSVEAMAAVRAELAGISIDQVRPSSRDDLMSGVARALIEQQRLFLHRLADRLGPYSVSDPLFTGGQALRSIATNPAPSSPGPTVKELVGAYLAAKQKAWAPKTYKSRTRQLEYLIEHLGPDTRMVAVQADHVREFRDALSRLRRNHHIGAGAGFAGRQTEVLEFRVSAKTVSLLFEAAKAFLKWTKLEGYVAVVPGGDLHVQMPKRKKGARVRRPFNATELEQLFRAPVYQGAKSLRRRFEPGDKIINDACFWLPLLGLYTGARLGELVQLQLSDVNVEGPIPFVDINEADGFEGDAKFVKSDAGIRVVPLHPTLIALGFRNFVERRRSQRKGKGRLFFEVAYGSDGMPSTIYSKRFGRLLTSIGLTDPGLVFHSLRHSAKDALRDGLAPSYVIDKLIGHADDATVTYGQGASLETCYAAIQAMKLPVDPISLLKSPA
jgi:integrase